MFSFCDWMAVPSRDFIDSTIDRAVALAAANIKAVSGFLAETTTVSVKIAPVVAQAATRQCKVFAYVAQVAFMVLMKVLDLAIELWCFVAHVCGEEYAIVCEFSSDIRVAVDG